MYSARTNEVVLEQLLRLGHLERLSGPIDWKTLGSNAILLGGNKASRVSFFCFGDMGSLMRKV